MPCVHSLNPRVMYIGSEISLSLGGQSGVLVRDILRTIPGCAPFDGTLQAFVCQAYEVIPLRSVAAIFRH